MSDNSRGHGKRFKSNHSKNNRYGNKDAYPPKIAEERITPVHISREFMCARCGLQITDLASAIGDKQTGAPVHFDCVVQFLQNAENLKQNEKITYIGQGRFAVVYFENQHDTRQFSIIRTIEWEERDKKFEWRTDISSQFSQIK